MIADQRYFDLWQISLYWMNKYEQLGQKYKKYASFKEAFYQSGLEFYLFLDTINASVMWSGDDEGGKARL